VLTYSITSSAGYSLAVLTLSVASRAHQGALVRVECPRRVELGMEFCLGHSGSSPYRHRRSVTAMVGKPTITVALGPVRQSAVTDLVMISLVRLQYSP